MWVDNDWKWHYQDYREVDRQQYGSPAREVRVACKKCRMCVLVRADEWVTRIMHESKLYPLVPSLFITLTYDREHYPERGWLRYQDVVAFLKRLRKHYPKARIRFVCAGEYGGQFHRPHYHLIIFSDVVLFEDRKVCGKGKGQRSLLYSSEILNRLWRQGTVCPIGSLTPQSAGYVARYAMKGHPSTCWFPDDLQIVDELTGEVVKTVHAPKEFFESSNRPGIGAGWYQRYASDFFPRDYAIRDGRKVPVPGYYLRLLERDAPEKAEAVKAKRREQAELTQADRTKERLAVRTEVTLAGMKASGTSRGS